MKLKQLGIGVVIMLLSMGCASKKASQDPIVDTDGLEQPKPISVGSAEVMLEFVSLSDNKVSVSVKEVHGYGASTDRIMLNEPIEMGMIDAVKSAIMEMNAGDTFNAVISMQEAGMNSRGSSWSITKIIDL